MQTVDFAVIAAAGIGSRLGHGIPKCLIQVGDKTLLGHLLDRLSAVSNIRICVGFMSDAVIEEARRHRPDAVFVMNHAFRSTTTLTSYVLAARGIFAPVLYMDADIYFAPTSFAEFLRTAEATEEPLIAVTPAKTEHCVFVHVDAAEHAIDFSRSERSDLEWANLAWLPAGTLVDAPQAVFEQLKDHLPIKTFRIESYEVDTPGDLQILKNNVGA